MKGLIIMANILDGLNPEQLVVATTIDGKVAVNATAGSGKTHTVVARTANMIQQGIKADNILLFTFTRKAAEEMKNRVASKIGNASRGMVVSTYHSFCVRLLRKYINKFGFRRGFSIYDEEDKLSLMNNVLDKMKETDKSLENFKARDFAATISTWKESMISPLEAIRRAQNTDNNFDIVCANFYKEYFDKMKTCNALDFDDLIYMAIRLLETNPTVLAKVNAQYKYIIADEAQDSSERDIRLIQLLAGPDSSKWNLCLVGDDSQSIYSFRGANVFRYIRFIRENEFTVLSLGQNYRSTKVVVEASDSLVRKNQTRIEKRVFTENEQGDNITMFTVNDDIVEAEKVSKIICACEKAGCSRDDIAVLYRTSSQSRVLEEQFLKDNVPYKIISGLPFYSRKEVKDMMAYVRLVLNQYDQEAFRRVANVPKRNIGPASVDAILSYVDENPEADVFDACEQVKLRNRNAQIGINNFVSVIEELYITANEINQNLDGKRTLADLIRRIVVLTDYEKHLEETIKSEEEVQQRMSNVYELINIARNYTDIEDFVESMMGYSEEDEEDKEGNATVKLLTMHASKGLEWPVVIIIGCNEGTSPHYLSLRDGNLEEERRLFYVAMTRAKKQLFLTRAKFAKGRSGFSHATNESRFIGEINERFINKR